MCLGKKTGLPDDGWWAGDNQCFSSSIQWRKHLQGKTTSPYVNKNVIINFKVEINVIAYSYAWWDSKLGSNLLAEASLAALDAQQGPVCLWTVVGYCSSGNSHSVKRSSKWPNLSFSIFLKLRFVKNLSVDFRVFFWKRSHKHTTNKAFCNSFQYPVPPDNSPPLSSG